MKTLEEKRATRPAAPTTKEEFEKWLEWYADKENGYAWDFDLEFEINGHIVSTRTTMLRHLVIDHILHSVADDYCTVFVNGIAYKPTEDIKRRIFGDEEKISKRIRKERTRW